VSGNKPAVAAVVVAVPEVAVAAATAEVVVVAAGRVAAWRACFRQRAKLATPFSWIPLCASIRVRSGISTGPTTPPVMAAVVAAAAVAAVVVVWLEAAVCTGADGDDGDDEYDGNAGAEADADADAVGLCGGGRVLKRAAERKTSPRHRILLPVRSSVCSADHADRDGDGDVGAGGRGITPLARNPASTIAPAVPIDAPAKSASIASSRTETTTRTAQVAAVTTAAAVADAAVAVAVEVLPSLGIPAGFARFAAVARGGGAGPAVSGSG
jgi:hypothetical protein